MVDISKIIEIVESIEQDCDPDDGVFIPPEVIDGLLKEVKQLQSVGNGITKRNEYEQSNKELRGDVILAEAATEKALEHLEKSSRLATHNFGLYEESAKRLKEVEENSNSIKYGKGGLKYSDIQTEQNHMSQCIEIYFSTQPVRNQVQIRDLYNNDYDSMVKQLIEEHGTQILEFESFTRFFNMKRKG